MNLIQQIDSDLVQAMKNKDEITLSVLRLIKSAIKNKQIEKNQELKNEDILQIISSQVKQRKDSIEQFTKGNRIELANKEQKEIDILQTYLPEQMSEEEITNIVNIIISKVGAKGPQDMGKVMGSLMAQIKGRADGTIVSEIVKKQLLP